jgi:DNA-binding LacI/PurR family transcriptional regulator
MARKGDGPATSAQVAAASGVSRATVSYVLNGVSNQTISAQTRERVLNAARRLNYAPDGAARALRRGHSDVVLFVLPDFPLGYVMTELLDELAQQLAERSHRLLMFRRSVGTGISEVVRSISPIRVISLGPLRDEEVDELDSWGVEHEVVSVDPPHGDTEDLPASDIGQLQTEHLVKLGHRAIAFGAPDDPRVELVASARRAGVRGTCEQNSVRFIDGIVPRDLESAENVVRTWVDMGVTGVCAYNDEVAIAVVAAARRAGIPVPGRLSVVGVDDMPVARFVEPTLTTVRIEVNGLARRLADIVTGHTVVRVDAQAVTLQERESSGRAPSP